MAENKSEKMATYEEIKEIADFILTRLPENSIAPTIGIVLGTGLGGLADTMKNPVSIPYSEIPGFPVSTVEGHAGCLVYGVIAGTPVICMKGRIHHYEGNPLWKCALPVRVMKLLGCVQLIVSNAAGALNPDFKVGDVMLIQDHVNFIFGPGPLLGPNDERFGPRFPSLYDAYNPDLIASAKKIAKELNMTEILREGTYVAVAGPNFETRAEMKLLRALGNDAVGMSTVHEVIVARHCDLRVFGFSLITDTLDSDVTHEANVEVGKMRGEILQQFVTRVVANMAATSTAV